MGDLADYGASVDSLDCGPTVNVRSLVDAWTGTRGVTLSLVDTPHTHPGPARLALDQVDDLISILVAARDHVAATTSGDAARPGSPLVPKFRADLPPKQPRTALGAFSARLVTAPGMWALHPSSPFSSVTSASASVSHINRGRSKAFPTSLFEAQARGADVYVRYMPKGNR